MKNCVRLLRSCITAASSGTGKPAGAGTGNLQYLPHNLRLNIFGRHAFQAHGAQAQGVMALGQTLAVFVHHEAAVIPVWIVEAQCLVEQDLPRGGLEQIFAAQRLVLAGGV